VWRLCLRSNPPTLRRESNPLIRVLIVDDEPLARRALVRLLRFHKDIEILGECGDGESAVTLSNARHPDLLFLDIRMPEKDGFQVVAELAQNARPAVVFVTAYDQHALQAFEVHAVDYLLKPFSQERLGMALDRVRERANRSVDGNTLQILLDELRKKNEEPPFLQRIPVTQNVSIRLLETSEIDRIEAMGNYARLHTRNSSFDLRETLQSLEKKLDPTRFVRIHRSSIINIDCVKEVQPWFRGSHLVVMKDGSEVRLSRYQREAVGLLTRRLRR
jgi:two-component system LytT family response regulator